MIRVPEPTTSHVGRWDMVDQRMSMVSARLVRLMWRQMLADERYCRRRERLLMQIVAEPSSPAGDHP
jgi:hypothetical protein